VQPAITTTGIAATNACLAATANEAADAVIHAALQSPRTAVRNSALQVAVERLSPLCLRWLIEHLHECNDSLRKRIMAQRDIFTTAVREAILSGDDQVCQNGCEAVAWLQIYDLLPTLLNATEDKTNPRQPIIAAALLKMVELFYEELAGPRDYTKRRDPQRLRDYYLSMLEHSLQRYAKHQSAEILEAFLLLVPRDNSLLKQILNEPRHPAYLATTEMLTHSTRGGVMRLVLSFLDDPHAPSSSITLLAYRTDYKFLEYLLKKIGYEPTSIVAANLKRIETIAWLQKDLSLLSRFDESCQHAVAVMALRSGLPRKTSFRVLEWLLLHGKAAGRRAAAKMLNEFQGTEANALVLQALADPDPLVQSALIAQLRPRGIPGAMTRLMDYLHSPHEAVLQAARESLSEFSFKKYLGIHDMLEPDVRRSTGELVLKVDPQALTELMNEYKAPSRTRRIRAMAITQTLDIVYAMEESLIELLSNDDHVVRAEAVRLLSQCDTETARQGLEQALMDRSVTVQDAARAGLQELDNAPPPLVPPLPWELETAPC
jgi:HEAT repeat protein